jgi:hypothetical protein
MAEKLHMTLGELQQRMTPEELTLWSLYLEEQAERAEEARKRAARRR